MYWRIVIVLALLLAAEAIYVGFRFVQQQSRAERAVAQLQALTADYERLRDSYNQAVRRTAVTELLAEHGKLSVVIRTAEGELKRIQTPYDPAQEIYVDYIILDGRLWIRRVFDQKTAPADGVLINPQLGDIDWKAPHVSYGKAVYRSLTEGRWVITVTGDGSLGLDKATDPPPSLSPPPPVRRFEELET